MLKIIRVPPDAREIHAHEITLPPYKFSVKKKFCALRLRDQYDKNGVKLEGKCSRICEHGYMVCTDDFELQFPIAIEGGKSDAVQEKEELTREY